MAELETSRCVGPVSSAKSTKVALRLQKKIEDGEYYEALQTYKALYQRYRAQNKDVEAVDLVYEGAATLLNHKQWECGNELAMILVNHYKEKNTPVTDDTFGAIGHLFSLYSLPVHTAVGADGIALRLKDMVEVNPRELFMRAALKWSSMVGEDDTCKYGYPPMHQLLALQYWKEKQYLLSADHFLYADDPERFAEMLVEFATTYGYVTEKDLFIARATLQLLVLNKPKIAYLCFKTYRSKHPQLKQRKRDPPYTKEPTLNFAWFLVYSCAHFQKLTAQEFDWLRQHYTAVIERDPSFPEYVDKIGALYFGVHIETNTEGQGAGPGGLMGLLGGAGSGGIFESLMGSLGGVPSVVPQVLPAPTTVDDPQIRTELTMLDSDDVLD